MMSSDRKQTSVSTEIKSQSLLSTNNSLSYDNFNPNATPMEHL
jgi:hypothetical protein